MEKALTFYKSFDIFNSMSKQRLQSLFYVFKPRQLDKGSFLFREGDKSIDGVYFVISGQLSRIKEDAYDTSSSLHSIRKQIPALNNKCHGSSITYIQENEIVGLEEILTNKKVRECSIQVSSSKAQILFMDRKDFRDKILDPFPRMKKFLQNKIENQRNQKNSKGIYSKSN